MKLFLLGIVPAILSSASLAAADPPTEIDYQGRISIGKRPFTGRGYFKFAITPSSEATNLWANDGTPAGEPAMSCEQEVTEGRFSTLLGAPPMRPLDSGALAADEACFLRVWFSQSNAAFHELKPKQKIASSPFAINALTLGGKSRAYFEDAARFSTGVLPDERLSPAVTRLGATIGAGELEEGTVGTREIADGSVRLEDLNLSETDARYVQKVDGALQGPLSVAGGLHVDGGVGIGTNQPAAGLHVAGSVRFEDGILFVAPVGDLEMGSYTNRP